MRFSFIKDKHKNRPKIVILYRVTNTHCKIRLKSSIHTLLYITIYRFYVHSLFTNTKKHVYIFIYNRGLVWPSFMYLPDHMSEELHLCVCVWLISLCSIYTYLQYVHWKLLPVNGGVHIRGLLLKPCITPLMLYNVSEAHTDRQTDVLTIVLKCFNLKIHYSPFCFYFHSLLRGFPTFSINLRGLFPSFSLWNK